MSKLTKFICLIIIIFASSKIKSIDISNELYPTSLALDYDIEKQEYTLYFQVINPAFLSKNENSSTVSKQSTFTLKEKGKSFYDCYNKLNTITKKRISLRHMQSLILTSNLLKNHDKCINLLLLLIKNPIIPTNLFLYGTDEKISDLYNNQNILDESSFFTILNNPQDSNISSFIYPLTLLQVTRNILDNNKMFYLPSIFLDIQVESSDDEGEIKNNKVLNLNGIFFSSLDNLFKYINLSSLTGFNYIYNNKINSLEINDINDKYFIKIHDIQTKIKVKNDKNIINITFDGIDLICPSNEKLNDIDKVIKNYIKNNIINLYNLGLNQNIDLLHISDLRYRYKKSLNTYPLEINIKTNYQSIDYYSMIT